jgi:uncharacterized protein YifE (UPF0438 family)
MTTFNAREISLLHYHLRFYQSLQAGIEPANTKQRKHFISAIMGQVDAKTEHEKVFLKYLSSNQRKVDQMVHSWSLNKSHQNNPKFDDEIF